MVEVTLGCQVAVFFTALETWLFCVLFFPLSFSLPNIETKDYLPSHLMAATGYVIFFLLFGGLVSGRAQTKPPDVIITPGSSLYPTHHTSWFSPSGKFAFGFYQQGIGFAVGIWIVGLDNNSVVWTANRNDPLVSSNAKLQLTKEGKLILIPEKGQEKLIANATATSASMLDSGNFVLYGKNSSITWQSCDYPTDTILGGQTLPPGSQLLSSSSETNHSSGKFSLDMQHDGNLVLYPIYSAKTPWDASWASMTFGSFSLHLGKTGHWEVMNSFDDQSNDENNTIYRATLDFRGIFSGYALVDDGSGKLNVSKLWSLLDDPCRVKGFCGFNSYCTYNDSQTSCTCLQGFELIDPNDNTQGCKRNFFKAECEGGKDKTTLYDIVSIENMVLGDRPYFKLQMTKEECRLSCLEDCICGVAVYEYPDCKKFGLPLRYVFRDKNKTSMAFLKVGTKSFKSSNDTPLIPEPSHESLTKNTANNAIIFVVLGFTLFLCSTIAISILLICKSRALSYKRLREIGDLGLHEEVALRLFSYNELKRATNDFKEELGKGSFGAVYKGALNKGRRLIAVKRLEKLVEEGEREFQAEMRAIGKTHHRNLVRLLGYCAEGSKRLLVYEYMSNGSLGKLIFGAARRPDWDERVRIALDVAKGILYLHEECEAPIIHCDIKPQNILLDEFWTAKISDFGLAKLLMPDQTRTFTMIRGTRGYLAPEWERNTPISVKADVYSYGIVLLEIVCCRRNIETNVAVPEQILLSSWVYNCFVERELSKVVHWDSVDENVLENMVKVALWCIQDEPALRPSMKSVVLMLEGITEIPIPPFPTATLL